MDTDIYVRVCNMSHVFIFYNRIVMAGGKSHNMPKSCFDKYDTRQEYCIADIKIGWVICRSGIKAQVNLTHTSVGSLYCTWPKTSLQLFRIFTISLYGSSWKPLFLCFILASLPFLDLFLASPRQDEMPRNMKRKNKKREWDKKKRELKREQQYRQKL